MNVVIYFKKVRDVKTFVIVSKNCYEAIKGIKINPNIKNIDTNSTLQLFPNIQTIQVTDLTYNLPHKILSQISYIRILDKMKLQKCHKYQFSYSQLRPPVFGNDDNNLYCFYINTKHMRNSRNNNYHSLMHDIFCCW
ncbi:hypothetical protein QTN25_008313 [Entamoeba marina]